MFTNWLTYRIAAEQLHRRIRGWQIGDIYTQDKNELIVDLHREDESQALHFSAHPQSAYLILRGDFRRAKKNSAALLKDATGRTIVSVAVAANDRIIRIALDDGSALFAVLYTTKSNLLYFNALGVITDSFKKVERTLDPASILFDDAVDIPAEEELLLLSQSERNTLKSLRPWLAGTLEGEILRRAHCTLPADAEGVQALQTALTAALDECCEPPFYVYSEHGIPSAFSLLRLSTAGLEEERFVDAFDALFAFIKNREQTKRLVSVKTGILRAIHRELERARRAIEHAAPETDLRAQADLYEKYGNLLMMNLERKPEQPGRMTVPDAFTDFRLVITVPVDPKRSVLDNAQRYFDKARNTRASIEYVTARKADMEAAVQRLERALALFSPIDNYRTLRDTMTDNNELMSELGLTGKGGKAQVFPFRRFTVAGGFDVWVGKNSENNDLLTVKNAKPNDLWFHARGVGGSHVVIKVDSAPGKPNKDTIREAAAIAAYYSKYRTAKTVPVAYTEKKYVRKPRGVPAGTVTLEREKVVMVKPGLPEGAQEE